MEAGRYKPYPAYKGSYAVWSGDVPEHWVPIRLKHVFTDKKKQSDPTLPAGSISFGNVIYKNEDSLAKETKAAYQVLEDGEFLINPLNMNYDLLSLRTALSSINVVVSTGYMILQSAEGYHKNYLRWLLQQFDVAHMKTLGAGVRQTISYTDIGNSFIFQPSLPEQTQIAAFLDYETAQIDALIAKQQRLIALLEEKRQAVISHAVTKGLDKSTPLRPSGIDWLGDVPAHWTVSSLKHFVRTTNGFGFSSADFRDEGVPFIRAGNIKNKSVIQPSIFLPKKVVENYERVVLLGGDILISMVGSDPKMTASAVGQIGIVPKNLEGAVPNQNVVIMREDNTVLLKRYLFYSLASSAYRNHLNVFSHKLANQSIISSSLLVSAAFTFPDKKEQQKIIDCLDIKLLKMDAVVTEARSAASLLKERRTALISAAVTGKIDLRDWQPPEDSTQDIDQNEEALA